MAAVALYKKHIRQGTFTEVVSMVNLVTYIGQDGKNYHFKMPWEENALK